MHTEKELLKGNTPALVLAVLNDAPLHGYGIAREIERRTDNALKCKEGTLYPALHALERDGHVTGEWQRRPEGGERKVYAITPAGRAELERRVQTWKKFAAAIGRALEGDPDGGARTPEVRSRRGRRAAATAGPA
ncbi:MAG TPA: helix-turn-helix transcriptional regulator [Chthonomonadaceae bacterium]|nr:helix-turn-helix transcriptional regulator [Chthonomonadaceae bacterium]